MQSINPRRMLRHFSQLLPINAYLYTNLHYFSNYCICIGYFYNYAMALLENGDWVTVPSLPAS